MGCSDRFNVAEIERLLFKWGLLSGFGLGDGDDDMPRVVCACDFLSLGEPGPWLNMDDNFDPKPLFSDMTDECSSI